MTTTLADLARLAGVSSATVSNALNNKPGVSETTRAHITRLARQVGYRPNRAGRALRQARTGTIGLYLPSSAINYGYYAEVTRGVATALQGCELSLLILPSSHDSRRIDTFPAVDGYILIEPHSDDRGVEGILRQDLPVVCGDRPAPKAGQPWGIVESPNERTTRQVLDRFLARGAKRPGLMLLERVSTWALELEDAYLHWCEEQRIRPRVALTSIHDSNQQLLTALRGWFHRGRGCDAVLVGGDGVAVRIAGILRSLGHQVGESVLLVSGVDSLMMEFHTPPITAIDLQPARFGATCAELLVELSDQPRPQHPIRRVVEAPLVERDSG